MKRTLYQLAIAVVAVVGLVGCEPKAEYPASLVGLWQSQTIGTEYYYLNVSSETTASLIAYVDGKNTTESLSLTYDANTGKGALNGEGRMLSLSALNDSTFTIPMGAGEFVFHPAAYIPSSAAEGYWYAAKEEVGLLVCPPEASGDIPVLLTYVDAMEEQSVEYGLVGVLTYTDETCTEATVAMKDETFESVSIQIVGSDMTCFIDGEPLRMKKQPNATDAPATAEGIWLMNMSVPMMGMQQTIEVLVQTNGNCVVNWTMTQEGYTESETITGKIYYCPVAGRGAFVPSDMFGEEAERVLRRVVSEVPAELCEMGIMFQALSATQVKLLLNMGMIPGVEMSLIFNKQ